LREEPWPNLGRHAHSLLRLTALMDYCHAMELGIGPGDRFQTWRKELWEIEGEGE
jgi:hypothetical protein